jgi:type IV pilus assembly protein PilN
MSRINLLPWREAERKRRVREFLAMLAGGLALALIVSFYVHVYVEGMIDGQNKRNTFLDTEIAQLNLKIREIQDLEKTKLGLISRMNVIQQLQESRPGIVHLFDELVNTIPEGVYLDKVSQHGPALTLEGRAQSNARVSAYMRNIDASNWLGGATLQVIEQKNTGRSEYSHFVLRAQQIDKSKKKGNEATVATAPRARSS